MLADELDYVVGVDTHRDQHALAIVAAPSGRLSRNARFARKPRLRGGCSLRRSVRAGSACLGDRRGRPLWRRACPLPRSATADGARGQPSAVPSGDCAARTTRSTRPGQHGPRSPARRSPCHARASGKRRCGCCCLPDAAPSTSAASRSCSSAAVIVTAPEELRLELRRLPVGELLRRCSRFRRSNSRTPDQLATIIALRASPAGSRPRPKKQTTSSARSSDTSARLVPELLDEPGVGPIVAAQLIVACSHHDRVRSEACFARLAGVAPLPASSGQTTRHRLSRGGDRQLNRALHTVILHRRQHDPATRDYIARRVAEGKSPRDATRSLKRYLARHLYRLMQNTNPTMT